MEVGAEGKCALELDSLLALLHHLTFLLLLFSLVTDIKKNIVEAERYFRKTLKRVKSGRRSGAGANEVGAAATWKWLKLLMYACDSVII